MLSRPAGAAVAPRKTRTPPIDGTFCTLYPVISASLISKIRDRDLAALAELDAQGISPAPAESPEEFATRLETLNHNFAKMEDALRSAGEYTVEGVTVQAASRIPAEIFAEPLKRTDRLFGFRCDWVPGFFFPEWSAIC